jgi:hypothetical protein
MTRITRFLLGAALAALAGSGASAETIQLRGNVQTVCVMNDEVASTSATTSVAGLTIFCNAADGAHMSMSLIDGDASGYRISGSGGSFVAKPGAAFDLKSFNTAFSGFEQIEIAQLDGAVPTSPVIMFEIVASD